MLKNILFILSLSGFLTLHAQDFKLMVQTGHVTDAESLEKIAFSPDSKYLISAGNAGKVIVWEVASGAKVKEYKTEASVPLSVAVSPNGQLVLASFDKPGKYSRNVLINIKTDEIVKHNKQGNRCAGAYFDDDRTVTMALGNKEVVKWDLDSDSQVAYFRAESKNSYDKHHELVVDPARKYAVICVSDNYCYVLDLKTLKVVKQLKIAKEVNSYIAFSPSSRLMSVTTVDGPAIYDTEANFKKVNAFEFGYKQREKDDLRFWRFIFGEFTDDEQGFRMSQYRQDYYNRSRGTFEEFNIYTEQYVSDSWISNTRESIYKALNNKNLSIKPEDKYNPIQGASQLTLSPDRKYLAAIKDYTGELRIYNWNTGNVVQSMYPTTLESRGIAVSPNGRYLVMSHLLGFVAYDMENLKMYTIEKPNLKKLTDLMTVSDEGILEFFTNPNGNYYRHDINANYTKLVIENTKEKYGYITNFKAQGEEKRMTFTPYKVGNDAILRTYGKVGNGKNFPMKVADGSIYVQTSDNGEWAINFNLDRDTKELKYLLLNTVSKETTEGSFKSLNTWPSYRYEISNTGRFFLLNGFLYDLASPENSFTELSRCNRYIKPIIMDDDKAVIYVGAKNQILTYEIASGEDKSFVKSAFDIYDIAVSADQKWLYAISESGAIQKWDVEKGVPLFSIITVDNENFALIWEDNYYTMSVGAYPFVMFVNGLNGYGFENFDLVYNRPDIIAERMGRPDYLQRAYHKAYLKRLKKMGFTESQITKEIALPSVNLNKDNIPAETNANSQRISFSASDAKYELDRINVYVNNVPIYGAKGISVDGNVKSIQKELEIPLNSGANKIEVSVHNRAGFESPREQASIHYQQEVESNLYVVAIGVSNYRQSEYNLTYAAKDALDIINTYKSNTKLYKNITVLDYTNEKATRSNILQAKSMLSQSKVDDEVILFVAGHGLLDEKLDYYFATHDVDFNNPAGKGLLYEDLEGLLDGIPARKKLMLIDACHSGEVDKDDATLVASSEGLSSGVSSRGFKMTIESKSKKLGLVNSFEIMNKLFADLRRGTGAVVISSASGAEYAFESSAWKNGVFTYALLEGLKTGNCDTDKSGSVQVSELKDYVFKRVVELTNGKQHPTSRRENLENDFVVW